jgi:hypothetical protein
LLVQYNKIDFGCLQCDSTKKVYVKITNVSKLDVNYDWSFVDMVDEEDQEPEKKD